MQSYRLCYYTASSLDITSLSQAVVKYRERGLGIKVSARTKSQLFDESRIQTFVREALAADLVVVVLHGGRDSCPAFDALVSALGEKRGRDEKTPHFHIQPTGGDDEGLFLAQNHSDYFGNPVWDRIHAYLRHGGPINFLNFLIYLQDVVHGEKLDIEPPQPLQHEGIYHPDLEGSPEIEEYLAQKVDPSKPTVGLWFNQTYWINNNLSAFDAVIREIERQGANVIPVFHLRFKDQLRGNQGADYIVEKFFKKDGRTRIDVLINMMMFSLNLAAPEYETPAAGPGRSLHPGHTGHDAPQGVAGKLQGLSSMEVSISAAQPEFDGALITVPVASREENTIDPITGALMSTYEPIAERTHKAVKLALNWAA